MVYSHVLSSDFECVRNARSFTNLKSLIIEIVVRNIGQWADKSKSNLPQLGNQRLTNNIMQLPFLLITLRRKDIMPFMKIENILSYSNYLLLFMQY